MATRRNFPLAISDVDNLFLYHKCNKTVPFRPMGGEVYVFRPDDSSEINDWVSDGHMFSCEGTRKIKGRIGAMTKKYFTFSFKQKVRKGSRTRGSGRKYTHPKKMPTKELLSCTT